MPVTLASLSLQLQSGELTSEDLVSNALARIEEIGLTHVFTALNAERALKEARSMDARRASGEEPSPWAGIPITVKDLFDMAGETTLAGSRVLAGKPAARQTALCIQRLTDAGFVILGKVNMTEFAYSGLGVNPHYGTPVNPYSGQEPRIPGGSSSGGGVSVASGLVAASIGTDTGGSVRIPAALCHLTGYKPPSAGVPKSGVIPLSDALDSVGPLANSVACCRVLDEVMSGRYGSDHLSEKAAASSPEMEKPSLPDAKSIRLLLPRSVDGSPSLLWTQVGPGINGRCLAAIERLENAGVQIAQVATDLFDKVLESGVQGVIAGFESSRWHQTIMEQGAELYDPRVLVRLQAGLTVSESDYQRALELRKGLIDEFQQLLKDYDAVVWPTTAIVAPTFAELEHDEGYSAINQMILRNTSVGNTLDVSAISLPLPLAELGSPAATCAEDSLPAGLMLLQSGENGKLLFSVAESLENLITGI